MCLLTVCTVTDISDSTDGGRRTRGGARLRPTLRALLLGAGMARVCAMLLLRTSSSVSMRPALPLSAARMLAGSSTNGSSMSGFCRPADDPWRLWKVIAVVVKRRSSSRGLVLVPATLEGQIQGQHQGTNGWPAGRGMERYTKLHPCVIIAPHIGLLH